MYKLLCLASIALLVMACNDSGVSQIAPEPPQRVLVNESNEFVWSLAKQVGQTEQSFFISGYSAVEALAMTANGANGPTKTEMLRVLNLGTYSDQERNVSLRGLRSFLLGRDSKVALSSANSIWIGQPWAPRILDSFKRLNGEYFSARIDALDFQSPESKKVVNRWIEEQTGGMLRNVIESFEPDLAMMLINALYFKAPWRYRFDTAQTYRGNFFTASNGPAPCSMMKAKLRVAHVLRDDIKAVTLPYGDGKFAMTLVEERTGDWQLSEMSSEKWAGLLGQLREDSAVVHLPKLSLSFDKSLATALQNLGMRTAFSGSADFSGITGTSELMVSDVRQVTRCEMSEEGTEAAAVTVVTIVPTSVGPNTVPTIVFDRPFYFAIHEVSTGLVVFVGRVARM